MTSTLRFILFVAIVIFFLVVIYLLKKNRLTLRYTLLWLGMAFIMLLLVIFPQLLEIIRKVLGFESGMNALYVIAIGFAIILLMALTSIVSHQSDRIKELVQDNAMLEKRIRELEQVNESEK